MGPSEEQVHSVASRSVLAWQVQPRCRCLQRQPGPLPAWGRWQPFSLHCYAWLLLKGQSLLSVLESSFDSGGAVRPDFDLSQIRSSHTPERTFSILKALSRLSLWLTCGAALLPVAHPSSKTGPLGSLPRIESVKTGCTRGLLSE